MKMIHTNNGFEYFQLYDSIQKLCKLFMVSRDLNKMMIDGV